MINLEKSVKKFARNAIRPLIPQSLYARFVWLWHLLIDRGSDLDWPSLLSDHRIDPVLKNMLLAANEIHGQEGWASNYWAALNFKQIKQLIEEGFDNFKQTTALHYFTSVSKNNYQLDFFKKHLSQGVRDRAAKQAKAVPHHSKFSTEESFQYNEMTYLLWEYLLQEFSTNPYVSSLEEPEFGNPPIVPIGAQSVTADLGNSLLDFFSMNEVIEGLKKNATVLELGAGYGRTSYVLMKARPDLRYVIVDIPPALYTSQRYLSLCFPERRIFTFRRFDSFASIEKEFLAFDLVFLMPGQLKLLPNKIADLFIAIDCLHEMRRSQIQDYFEEMDRLAKNTYFSCRKTATVPYEKIILSEKDYAPLPSWQQVYWRERKVHSDYFEALFTI